MEIGKEPITKGSVNVNTLPFVMEEKIGSKFVA
jgi:hypothetical protein